MMFPLDFWRNLRMSVSNEVWWDIIRIGKALDKDDLQWALAEAIYWLANDFGGSGFDPLRIASNLTEFSPGICSKRPSEGYASGIYAIVEDYFLHKMPI